MDIKLRLAVEIVRVIEARRLSQVAEGFSVERLLTFLLALGKEVEIRIRPRRASKGRNRILFVTVDR